MARGPLRGWNRWKQLGILMSQQAFTIILHHWKFFIFQNSSYPNMADLHQFLKSPQNNSNAAKQSLYTMFQHQNTHRRSDIVIQWKTFFHIGLFWCKPAMNELFVCPEKIIILWIYLSLFLWAISCIFPLLNMLPLRGLCGQYLLLTLDYTWYCVPLWHVFFFTSRVIKNKVYSQILNLVVGHQIPVHSSADSPRTKGRQSALF